MSTAAYPKFPDATAEIAHVLECHAQERAAEEQEFREEWLSLPLSRRRALGISLYPLQFREAQTALGDRFRLRFEIEPHARGEQSPSDSSSGAGNAKHRTPPRSLRLQAGQVVELFRRGSDGEARAGDGECVRGILAELRPDRLSVIADAAPDWLEDAACGLNLVFNETTYREMEQALNAVGLPERRALERFRNRLLAYDPVLDPLRMAGGAVGDSTAETDGGTGRAVRELAARLNPAQQRAVAGVQALAEGQFAIVHGPPGTGKTTTITAAVAGLVARGDRVLVTAPTNAAADLLAESIATALSGGEPGEAKPQGRGLRVLRLGHPARVSEELWKLTLEGALAEHPEARNAQRYREEANELFRKARKFRRNFGAAERAERNALLKEHGELRKLIRDLERAASAHILESAGVIVCTLVGAASDRLRALQFDCAVIDEATQAIEGAAWIPLLRAPRAVLAGDHCQLPPTIRAAPELEHTLFEKIITRHAGADCIFFLDTQYRMEPEILAFSNAEFYENQLESGAGLKERVRFPIEERGWTRALLFIDTAGCDFTEELDPESESYANPGEARLLAAVYSDLHSTLLENQWSAGVIATYRQQVELLRSAGDGGAVPDIEGLQSCEIDTVDAFQGRECDVILISLVRSNEVGETGFLGETRRMNVALTRAKRLLVVVGDSATLARHPFYDRFLKHVEAHGDYRSAYEFLEIV